MEWEGKTDVKEGELKALELERTQASESVQKRRKNARTRERAVDKERETSELKGEERKRDKIVVPVRTSDLIYCRQKLPLIVFSRH